MAKNFSQLITSLRDWLNVEDQVRLPDSVCGDLINWAVKEYCRNRESRFGEVSDTFASVAGQRDYTVPVRWSKPRKIWFTNPDTQSVFFLEYLDKDIFDSKFPDSTKTDDPRAFTMWAGNIQLGKTPKRVLTFNRDFYQIPADLVVGSNEENDFTRQADQYLLFKALCGASIYGIEDERLPVWMAEMQRFEAALDSEDSRRAQTARVSQGREPG